MSAVRAQRALYAAAFPRWSSSCAASMTINAARNSCSAAPGFSGIAWDSATSGELWPRRPKHRIQKTAMTVAEADRMVRRLRVAGCSRISVIVGNVRRCRQIGFRLRGYASACLERGQESQHGRLIATLQREDRKSSHSLAGQFLMLHFEPYSYFPWRRSQAKRYCWARPARGPKCVRPKCATCAGLHPERP